MFCIFFENVATVFFITCIFLIFSHYVNGNALILFLQGEVMKTEQMSIAAAALKTCEELYNQGEMSIYCELY